MKNKPKNEVVIVSHLICKHQIKNAKTNGRFRICLGWVTNPNWFDFIFFAHLRDRNF